MVQEERLDPHYFSTTPKNSWELFKWLFTEPIKLGIFSRSLLFKKKERLLWFVKTFIWIAFFSAILFSFSYFIIICFDPSHFDNIIPESWNQYIHNIDNSLLRKIGSVEVTTRLIIFFLLGLIFSFINGIFFTYNQSLVNGFTDSLSISFILAFSISLELGLAVSLGFAFARGLLNSFTVGPTEAVAEGIAFAFIFGIASSLVFDFTIGLRVGLIFMFTYYFILFGGHSYLYHFFYSMSPNISLDNNPYLKDSYIAYPISILEEKLANESFNQPLLSLSFIDFLFEFRLYYQTEFAFYLLNVVNASKLYNNKLSFNHIEIAKKYEANQPTENFINTLQILKNELKKYQIQNNIHHKIVSLQKVREILKDLEQQMIIEIRGWREYYLKAIRANLDEANARLKNLELEAKNREPITPNIYETGNPLSPNYQNQLFKGRKDLVDRLSNIIYTSQQMPLLLIQGQRRVGKTSLINYLEQLLGSGFKIVKLDMQSATNKEFGSLVKNINQELNSMLGIDKTIETSDDIMQSWIAFEEYLTKYTKALNYKIIIAFDEYESFHEYIVQKHGKIILENMRSFIQSQNQIIFLFSGMLRISDLTSPNWDEYFPQAQRLKVDYLSQDESFELITHPVDDFNLVYSDEVADEVYRWTMGHPQLLQTICSNIVTIANQTNQKRVTFEMVAKAKDEVFEVNEMPMTIFWREFCGDEEREIIEQILTDKAIIRETREQKRAMARLIDYGFIVKIFGAEASDSVQYRIFVPLFEKWLVERQDLIEI